MLCKSLIISSNHRRKRIIRLVCITVWIIGIAAFLQLFTIIFVLAIIAFLIMFYRKQWDICIWYAASPNSKIMTGKQSNTPHCWASLVLGRSVGAAKEVLYATKMARMMRRDPWDPTLKTEVLASRMVARWSLEKLQKNNRADDWVSLQYHLPETLW